MALTFVLEHPDVAEGCRLDGVIIVVDAPGGSRRAAPSGTRSCAPRTIFDRDSIFSAQVIATVKSLGIKPTRTA